MSMFIYQSHKWLWFAQRACLLTTREANVIKVTNAESIGSLTYCA